MRYPYRDGTKITFDKYFKIAQGFGAKTTYGFHDGLDINLKTGGDTDLGEPIYAIHTGEVTSVHKHTSIPTFGNHIHYLIEGKWGTRYIHHSHCHKILVKVGDRVTEGQKIGEIGKSGTFSAHDHFAIKLKPTGIDAIAKTKHQLEEGWQDPLEFIEEFMKDNSNGSPVVPSIELDKDVSSEIETILNLKSHSWYNNHWTWKDFLDYINFKVTESSEYSNELKKIRSEVENLRMKNTTLVKLVSELTGAVSKLTNEKNEAENSLQQAINEKELYYNENQSLKKQIAQFEGELTVSQAIRLLISAIVKKKREGDINEV